MQAVEQDMVKNMVKVANTLTIWIVFGLPTEFWGDQADDCQIVSKTGVTKSS